MNIDILETLTNVNEERDYKIKIVCPEFTCLCPGKRDQPDFATMTITYVPDELLVELKSLKYYIVDYRDKELYHEEATNRVLDDLVRVLEPRFMRVRGDWNVRGGIKTIVEVDYTDEGWEGEPEKVQVSEKKNTASLPRNS